MIHTTRRELDVPLDSRSLAPLRTFVRDVLSEGQLQDKAARQVVIAIDEALDKLERRDKLKADLIKLRFYAGLTIEQSANSLGISLTTAKTHWAYARAWLLREVC